MVPITSINDQILTVNNSIDKICYYFGAWKLKIYTKSVSYYDFILKYQFKCWEGSSTGGGV